MPVAPRILINTPEIELWPGGLLRARSNRDARVLARARHVLRRKRDGKYLAADLPEGL
nr:D-alanyl-D-alanine carboxypeptidase family protein [Pseudomonadota bacterium]